MVESTDENAKEHIYAFLKETSKIFSLVKKYSILIEELLPANKAPIHAANELKSLVFHLYNASTPNDIEVNILEAKEHLCRAFYDLHSMVVSIYIKKISDDIRVFKQTTVAAICPEYAQTIRPQMRDIQENIREIRSNRNTDIVLLQTGINSFEEHTKTLAKFGDIVESYSPDFIKYEAEIKASESKNRRWEILKIIIEAIIGGAIGLIIGYYWGKAVGESGKNDSTPKTEQPAPAKK